MADTWTRLPAFLSWVMRSRRGLGRGLGLLCAALALHCGGSGTTLDAGPDATGGAGGSATGGASGSGGQAVPVEGFPGEVCFDAGLVDLTFKRRGDRFPESEQSLKVAATVCHQFAGDPEVVEGQTGILGAQVAVDADGAVEVTIAERSPRS